MHQAALDAAGKDIQYIRIEVEPGGVKDAFDAMAAMGFIGCNVTVPHKLDAMALCDELTEDAKALGATNTILFSEDKIIGHNTDGPGLAQAILEDFGTSLTQLRTLILGAGGGAGRAIATQCAREGSPAILLSNRSIEKLAPIAQNLAEDYQAKLVYTLSNSDADLIEAAQRADLIINATSLGLHENDPLPLPVSALDNSKKVYDAIYNPYQTNLLKEAENSEAIHANGLSMLLHQGALAYQFWFNETPDIELMREALENAVY